MIDNIKKHIAEVEEFTAKAQDEVEAFRIKYLGSKGLLKDFFSEFKNVPNEQKKEFGQTINALKKAAEEKVNFLKNSFDTSDNLNSVYGDLTRPGEPFETNHGRENEVGSERLTRVQGARWQTFYDGWRGGSKAVLGFFGSEGGGDPLLTPPLTAPLK